MKAFNKQNLPTLRDDINAALAAVGEKHGISLRAASARFDDKLVTYKLEGSILGDGGEVVDKYAVALQEYHPELVGKQITLNDKRFTVVGFNTSSRKWSFHIKDTNGKISTTTRSEVMR